MRKYIPNYTETFRDELLKWFAERMDRLPKSLQYNASSYSSDLHKTVDSLSRMLRANKPGVTFSGYMEQLLQIKDKLQEQGL
ncbi:MAG: hypothetical protein IJ064_04270 [Bacteroidaceae bacterium]|nr:hypothetical protein [Bacteroidaceae bacterium]